MENQIEGPILKLKRAKHHIDDVEKIIISFFKLARCNIVIEKDDKSDDKLVKVKLDRSIPETLPLVVGDAVFNIRSSLDHLAVELYKLKTGSYPNSNDRINFPIKSSKEKFEYFINKDDLRNNFPKEAIELLKAIKPYKGGDNLLWSINILRNFDTHNFILPMGTTGNLNLFQYAKIVNAKIGIVFSGPGRLDEGIVISNLGEHGTLTFAHNNQPNIVVSGQMIFGEVEIIYGKNVIDTLNEMHKLVGNILAKFKEKCF